MDNKTIGQNIKELRTKKGLSHDELSDLMKVPANVLVDWERDYGGPNGDQMMQLVNIFNVSYNEIAGRVNKPSWSISDIVIMVSLAIILFQFFKPLFITDSTSFNMIALWGTFFTQSVPVFVSLLSIGLGACTISLLVMLFLFIQNPKRFQFYGNTIVNLLVTILFVLSGLFIYPLVKGNSFGLNQIVLVVAAMVPFIVTQIHYFKRRNA